MRLVELQECCQIINGSTPSRNTKEYWDGDISWFTPKDLSGLESKYIEDSPEFITLEGYNSCSTTMIPAGSLLFTSRAPIGHLAINRKKSCTNQGFKTLVPNEGVDVEYLYYVIKKNVPKLQDLGNGATFKELSKATISKFKIPLPPLEEQKKIAAILDAADDYRQKTKALIDKYDELTQSLFLDMFGDPVTNPKGWEVRQLKQILNLDRPLTYGILKPEEHDVDGVVMLRIQDIKGSKVNNGDFHKVSKSLSQRYKRTILIGGEIVISLVGTIGLTAKISNHLKDSNLHRNLGLISLDEKIISQDYFFNYTLSKGFMFQIKSLTKGGNQPLLNLGSLERLEVNIPPLQLQNQFAERIQAIEVQKAQAQASLIKAKELFNSVLQKDFKGELTN